MPETTHQLSTGTAPGWAHCGAWIAAGDETTEPTCPRCAVAREDTRAMVRHQDDAIEAFLTGDLLIASRHHTQN